MNATRRRTTRTTPRTKAARSASTGGASIVRLSRVRTVLQRIESGYYDRAEIRRRLATAVLKELQKI